jgi:hypothetical protein
MPRKDISERNGPGRGRPVGSTNKFPQILRHLVLNAADKSGYPTEKWITEPALDDEGNTIWVEATDPKTHEVKKDKNGNIKYRLKMKRRRVLEWTGIQGAEGYLMFLAHEERNYFTKLLTLAQAQQDRSVDHSEGLQLPTLEELREEWIRQGLRAVDFDKMKVVKNIKAKQRVRMIEHDPREPMRVRNGSKKQQDREAASATEPESEQWWPDEPEEDEGEAED